MTPRDHDPVLADALEARLLSGLSGAGVYLMTRDGRHWFVRKAARDAAASVRLRGQAARQARFQAAGLTTPRILAEGDHDGRFFFDMELVRGLDAASWLRRATLAEVRSFGDRLCAYLEAAAAAPPLAVAPAPGLFEAIYAKLCQVAAHPAGARMAPDVLAQLFLALDRVRRLGPRAPTLCHGDLTLENIVVGEGGQLTVLDLLDAPYEHYWQDVAKLHQDLAGGWYLLTQPRIAASVLDHLSRRLCATATRLDPGYPEVHALLLAATFVRILPYARDDAERAFVAARIDHFTSLLRTTP